ncbi:MAG: DUF4870 domain-containing protein [Bacteroidota bacterium]
MEDLSSSSMSPLSEDEKTWGMLVHLSSLSGFFLGAGWIIAPLIIYLVKKDEMPYVAEEGKKALNFQLSMLILSIISGILTILLVGFIGLLAVFIMQIIFPIIAGLRARDGEDYRYPLTYDFIR